MTGNKWNKYLLFKTLSVFIFIGIFQACTENNPQESRQKRLANFRDRVEKELYTHPEKTIQIADSAIALAEAGTPDDSLLIVVMDLRMQAQNALGQRDSIPSFLLKVLERFQKENWRKMVAYTTFSLGQHFLESGQTDLAERHFVECRKWMDAKNDYFMLAMYNNQMGDLQRAKGNYREAQHYLILAASFFTQRGLFYNVGGVYINLANTYKESGNEERANFYYHKALEVTKKSGDTTNYIAALGNLASYFLSVNTDSAEFYFSEVMKFQGDPKFNLMILANRLNMANLMVQQKEWDEAKKIYQMILDTCSRHQIFSGIARAYNGLGNIHEAKQEDQKALDYYQKAYHMAESIGEKPVALVFLGNIQYMHEKAGRYREALELQKQISSGQDSLLNLEKQIAIHNLELVTNKERTEKENAALQHNLHLQETKFQSTLIFLGLVLLSMIAIGLLAWRIYLLYRQRDQAYLALISRYQDQPETNSEKYQTIHLINRPLDKIDPGKSPDYAQLIEFFEQSKPYLDPRLKIEDVSTRTGLTNRTILNLLQTHHGMHFKTFVNQFRIEEAKRLLRDEKSKTYKIEIIARQSGFGSKVNFYNAFGSLTGFKPSEYRNETLEK